MFRFVLPEKTRQDKTHRLPVLVRKRFLRQFKVFFSVWDISKEKKTATDLFNTSKALVYWIDCMKSN